MIREIDSIFNIIDVVVVGIFLRSIYIGFKEGIVVELFKLLGITFATFFTLHYFAVLARSLTYIVPIPPDMLLVFAYVLIWVLVVVLFSFVRQGWMLGFPPLERTSFIKFTGAAAGTVRAVFVSGLLFVALFMTGQNVLANSARRSYSGFYLKDFSAGIYKYAFEHFVSPVFPAEPFNKKLFEYGSSGPETAE